MVKFFRFTSYLSYLVAFVILISGLYYFYYLENEWSLLEFTQRFGLSFVITLQAFLLSKAAKKEANKTNLVQQDTSP